MVIIIIIIIIFFTDVPNEDPSEVNDLYIDSGEDENDSSIIIKQLSKKQNTITSVQDRQQKLLQQYYDLITSCNSHEKLDALQKTFNSLNPILGAIDNSERNQNFQPTDNIVHNEKIIPQRQFWPTKKKTKKSNSSIKKPTSEESDNIAVQILSSNRS